MTATGSALAVPINAQPVLERLSDGLFAKAESSASGIYQTVEQLLTASRIDGLVLQSPSHVHPCWVKVECWLPVGSRLVTERASAIIMVEPRPFHRFDLIYSVTLDKCGKKKVFRDLRQFTRTEAAQVVQYLISGGPEPNFKALQVRQKSWQFWKPLNKVDAVTPDWLAIGVSLLLVVGLVTLSIGIGVVLIIAGLIALYLMKRRIRTVRSIGKPLFEPRNLKVVDAWQTVISGAGADAEVLRRRFLDAVADPPSPHFRSAVERIWYWGLDGKEEREQMVLSFNRAIFFAQIYRYGSELYIGWDSHVNRGTWVEKTITTGIDRDTGRVAQVNTVISGYQNVNEYDLSDVSCLTEWAHAQLVRIIKRYMEERRIDQEIDFKIIRGERQGVIDTEQRKPAGGFIKRMREAAQA